MAPNFLIVQNRIRITNYSRLKIAENLDFRLILCKMIQPWVRQFNGKMRILCLSKENKKKLPILHNCLLFLFSIWFAFRCTTVWWKNRPLSPPIAKKKSYFLPLLHNFFSAFKYHQPRISIYLSIYKITSFSNWNNWKKSDVLGLRVELDSSMG